MRTIAVVNLKGGVGKTTTALSLGQNLNSIYQKKVLFVDNDFSANISKFFKVHNFDQKSMEDVLRNPCIKAEDVIKNTEIKNVDVIPSNMNLTAATEDLITDQQAEQMTRIKQVLNQVKEKYDYCIIDCHPGIGIEVLNALVAADDVIIPIKADKNSLDGMEDLTEIIEEIRPYNDIKLVKCLVTMFTKDLDVIKGEAVLKKSKYSTFDTHIRYSKRVTAWTYELGKSLLDTTIRSGATKDYKKLTEEYLKITEGE